MTEPDRPSRHVGTESGPAAPSVSPARPPLVILGVPFDDVTMTETLTLIEAMIAARRPHYLATARVDFVVQAHEDEELRRILFEADLVLCDGTPLVWASRWLSNPLPERVAGSDLVPHLLRLAAARGYRVYFLGGHPDTTALAVKNVERTYPGIQVAGWDSPPFAPLLEMDHAGINARILAARPDLLLVSFGCPKQEKWIAMNHLTLGVPVSIGIGATIDFLAGTIRRAPMWLRRAGLEWVFRLLQEPRRLYRRYAKDLRVFGWALLRQRWLSRPGPTNAAQPRSAVPVSPGDVMTQIIALPARLDAAQVRTDGPKWLQAAEKGTDVICDLSAVEFVDSTGLGLLVRLHRRTRTEGGLLVLVAESDRVRRSLQLMRLETFFARAGTVAAGQALAAARRSQKLVAPGLDVEKDVEELAWQGEITASTVNEVWKSTDSLLTSGLPRETTIQIDLGEVRFMDTTGRGLMLKVRRAARQRGYRVEFRRAPENVRRIIRLAGLEFYLLWGSP